MNHSVTIEDFSDQKDEEEPEITIRNLGEIADGHYPDKPVIDGLLGEKENLLIVGPSGIGKSLLTVQIALSLGGKKTLWDVFGIPRSINSLIIQSENGITATHKRLNMMFQENPSIRQYASRVFIPIIYDDCRLTGSLMRKSFGEYSRTEFIDRLAQIINVTETEIFLLDPLISYHGVNENDNAAMRQALDCITEICDMTGAASIVVHHVGKSSTDNSTFSGRGASAIGDWAANIISLEKLKDNENIIKVKHEKARNYPIREEQIFLKRCGLLFNPVEDSYLLKPKKKSRINTVVDCLKELGGSVDIKQRLVEKVMDALGISKGTAQNAIHDAIEAKAILVKQLDEKNEGYILPK